MPAKITISLMKLQQCIWAIENLKKANDVFDKATLNPNLIGTKVKDACESNKVGMLKIPLVQRGFLALQSSQASLLFY